MLNVVFYGRVSTENEEQLQSLNSQIEYFTKFINQNKDWELCGKYIDEGITGTSIKKRIAFQQMMQDAKEHKFDLILTREVSRFARNTVDTLQYTRELKSLGIGVIFTLDNIDTRDKDGELRLTIMASLAQEEARKTSNNVKWKHEHLMRQGAVFGNSNIFGYDVVDKKLIINQEQAEVVKLIYKLYLDGLGYRRIQKELIDNEFKTATGKYNWSFTVVRDILLNEKYTGKLVQKKYVTLDYLDKVKTKNKNTEDLIIVENNHDPIISEETFQAVQQEMERRFSLGRYGQKYESRHVLSSKIQCGICGRNLRRNLWNRNLNGTRSYGWKCSLAVDVGRQLQNGEGCNARGVSENIIYMYITECFFELYNRRHEIIEFLSSVLESNLNDISLETDIAKSNGIILKYKEKIDGLLDLFTDNMINKKQFQEKKKEYEQIIYEQQNILNKFDNLDKEKLKAKKRIQETQNFLENMGNIKKGDKIDDDRIEAYLDHIIIFNKNHIEIHVKSYNCFLFKDGEMFLNGVKIYPPFSECGTRSTNQNTVSLFSFSMPSYDCTKTKIDAFIVI